MDLEESKRLALHILLVDLLGSTKVYFQPPSNLTMEYPCIVYSRDSAETAYADNKPYRHMRRYQVTVIDLDPDSNVLAKIADLPLCSFSRHFKADNLNQDVYDLFF